MYSTEVAAHAARLLLEATLSAANGKERLIPEAYRALRVKRFGWEFVKV